MFSACPDHRENLQSKGSTVISNWKDYRLRCVISNERKCVGLQLSILLSYAHALKSCSVCVVADSAPLSQALPSPRQTLSLSSHHAQILFLEEFSCKHGKGWEKNCFCRLCCGLSENKLVLITTTAEHYWHRITSQGLSLHYQLLLGFLYFSNHFPNLTVWKS